MATSQTQADPTIDPRSNGGREQAEGPITEERRVTADTRRVTETRRRRTIEEERSIGALFRELTTESAALVRAEMSLARHETGEKINQLQKGAIQMGTAGVFLLLGLGALTAGIIFLLALAIPLWASALIVGGVVLAIGGIAAYMGKKNVEPKSLEPERTLRTMDENRQVMKEQLT